MRGAVSQRRRALTSRRHKNPPNRGLRGPSIPGLAQPARAPANGADPRAPGPPSALMPMNSCDCDAGDRVDGHELRRTCSLARSGSALRPSCSSAEVSESMPFVSVVRRNPRNDFGGARPATPPVQMERPNAWCSRQSREEPRGRNDREGRGGRRTWGRHKGHRQVDDRVRRRGQCSGPRLRSLCRGQQAVGWYSALYQAPSSPSKFSSSLSRVTVSLPMKSSLSGPGSSSQACTTSP